MDPGAETDRLRFEFLSAEFKLCFTFLDVARVELQSGDREHAEHALRDAERGCQTIHRFLEDRKHVEHLTAEQLAMLRDKMRELRKAIDDVRGTAPRAISHENGGRGTIRRFTHHQNG